MRRYHAHLSILVSKKIDVCPGVVVVAVAVRVDTVGQHLEQLIHNKQWYITRNQFVIPHHRNPTPTQQTVVKLWSMVIQSLAPLLTLSISSQAAWNSN